MKVAPVSADLLIKLALVAAGIGLAVYLVKSAKNAAGDAIDKAAAAAKAAASNVADSVIVGLNPGNTQNWVNRGVSAAGGAIAGPGGAGSNADGSWTLGGAIYDLLHPSWAETATAPTSAVTAPTMWGSEGRRNQPIFGAESEEVTDWGQLSSLGAP